jgi:hypothetical protein
MDHAEEYLRRGTHILVLVLTRRVMQAHVPPAPSAWRTGARPVAASAPSPVPAGRQGRTQRRAQQ